MMSSIFARSTRIAALGVVLLCSPRAGEAQVAQWNHRVDDQKLEMAFHLALNQAVIEHVRAMQEQKIASAILFLDSQKDLTLLMTTSKFRHNLLAASRAKAHYVVTYQAQTSAGVTLPGGLMGFGAPAEAGLGVVGGGVVSYGGPPEIPGDGARMLCPVNKGGLTFMYGALALSSLDKDGKLRVEQDGADINKLRERILQLTYEHYGVKPE